VEIGLTLDRIGTSSVTYRLGAFVTDMEDAAAEALFTHVLVDRARRRPLPVPADWRTRLETLR
jgi:acyl-CoA thioester hydrolase